MPTNAPRIVRFFKDGGPLVLEPAAAEPLGAGEARLRVEAIGLNRVEELFQAGAYFVKPVYPSKLGVEAAGVVEEVGEGVDPAWVGRQAALIPSLDMTAYGAAGELVVIPADRLVETPEGVSSVDAAATWMAYLTAYGALVPGGRVKAGDFVLINAASSSVGLAMIQVAHALGGHVIAMTRTASKRDALLKQGAEYVIVSQEEDLVAEVRKITGGAGARLVFDPVAGKGIMQLAEAAADAGTVIIGGFLGTDMFGYKDGEPTPFPFIQAVARNLNIRGYSAQGLMADAPEMERAKTFIATRLASGDFKPAIDRIFPFDAIEDAYAWLRTGGQTGKIVVKP